MAVKKPQPAKQKKAKDLDVGKAKVGEKVKGGMNKNELVKSISGPTYKKLQ